MGERQGHAFPCFQPLRTSGWFLLHLRKSRTKQRMSGRKEGKGRGGNAARKEWRCSPSSFQFLSFKGSSGLTWRKGGREGKEEKKRGEREWIVRACHFLHYH